MLAVLVQRGGTDGLQLTASQHGLEDGRGVDRTFGGTGPDQGVDLVDEQHDVTAGLDLFEHLLQALLEVAAVTAAGDQGPQVEGVDLLVAQRLGDIAADDALGQALDDRRLADARFTDQHRVVLGTPAENGHHALDLGLAADHRVEPVLAGGLGQVTAELVEHGVGTAGRLAHLGRTGGDRLALGGALVAAQQLQHGVADPVEVGAELDQRVGGDTLALANQPEQDVFGADVGMVHLQCFAQRQLQDLLGPRGERNMTGRLGLAVADDLLDLRAHRFQRDAHLLQGLGGHALTLVDETEQDVLRADVVVVQHLGLVLGQHHHPARAVSETLEHSSPQVGSVRASVGPLG